MDWVRFNKNSAYTEKNGFDLNPTESKYLEFLKIIYCVPFLGLYFQVHVGTLRHFQH